MNIPKTVSAFGFTIFKVKDFRIIDMKLWMEDESGKPVFTVFLPSTTGFPVIPVAIGISKWPALGCETRHHNQTQSNRKVIEQQPIIFLLPLVTNLDFAPG